ncbi:MAG TPA: hypothetical protein PKN23_00215 [Candidatus Hydrogenedentes bacterium]|nr:hypothetical protein [Candidatus Hydrogenedentota bacterium]HOH52182.1 hypothetical protein [Candidatus Hydrogenedentota bacterium]
MRHETAHPGFRLRGAALLAPVAALLLAVPGCFSSCGGTPPKGAAAPAAQSPASPAPAPALQTPATPLPAPAQSPSSPAPVPDTPPPPAAQADPEPVLTLEALQAVREGMTMQEVSEVIGPPAVLIAGARGDNAVYRWNERGLSFLARFEDGHLSRKTVIDPENDRPKVSDEDMVVDRELFERVREGMSLQEVLDVLGAEGQPLTEPTDEKTVAIYRWSDGQGSSVTARFEDGKLVRKSGSFVQQGAPVTEEETVPDAEPAPEPVEEEPPAEEAEPREAPASRPVSTSVSAERAPRVRVSGSSRRQREAESGDPNAGRSYKPKAQLPKFSHRLREGSYEIRVVNTSGSAADVAVVSDEGGARMTIPPGGSRSAKVNRGNYVVYFIYEDDPHSLHRGGNIAISEWLTDMDVLLAGDDYDVRVLNKGAGRPEPRRSRR